MNYAIVTGIPMVSLRNVGLVYLASPYSKYPHGIEAAFRDVCAIAAEMMRDGVRVYSPIAHTHPIAIYGNIDPCNHDIWLPFDHAMMDAAAACVVANMVGWQESYGVRYEVNRFIGQHKPVYARQVDGSYSAVSRL